MQAKVQTIPRDLRKEKWLGVHLLAWLDLGSDVREGRSTGAVADSAAWSQGQA